MKYFYGHPPPSSDSRRAAVNYKRKCMNSKACWISCTGITELVHKIIEGPSYINSACWVIFHCHCRLLTFHIKLYSKNSFQNTISVKQFGSRSEPTFCLSGGWF